MRDAADLDGVQSRGELTISASSGSRRGCLDAPFLRDRSLPAASTRKWAVADPARVRAEECGEVAAEVSAGAAREAQTTS